MTRTGNELPETDSGGLSLELQGPTSLNSKRDLLQRLRRGKPQRSRFVESHISKTLAFQTRALREREGWSQQTLAEKIGSNQNAVYRAENPNYGKQTITTLKKIAAAFDVALVVRFVPFSELVDWVSGTPHVIDGLNTEALDVRNFDAEKKAGKFYDGSLSNPKEELDPKKPVMTAAEKNLRELTERELTANELEFVRQHNKGRARAGTQSYTLTIKPGAGCTLQPSRQGTEALATGLLEPWPEWLTRALEAGQREVADYLAANYSRGGNLKGLAVGPQQSPKLDPIDQSDRYKTKAVAPNQAEKQIIKPAA